MNVFAKTDKGLVRSNNQDTYVTGEIPAGIFAVVCDGMGGVAGGEIASRFASEAIAEKIRGFDRPKVNFKSAMHLMEASVNSANINILDYAKEHRELDGMGTTAVISLIVDGVLYLGHVGDSRAYLLNSEGMTQLTKDHSLVQELVDNGSITHEEMNDHPYKNIITRAIGSDEEVAVDVTSCELKEGDMLLLCTDGLSNFVSDEKIYELYLSRPMEQLASSLVAAANGNGGADNITVVVIYC